MYKLKISPKAKDDLAEIKGYISQELCNPQAALNLVSRITKKIRGLPEHPGLEISPRLIMGLPSAILFFHPTLKY
jgi:plasmid stabilization system protein ParE